MSLFDGPDGFRLDLTWYYERQSLLHNLYNISDLHNFILSLYTARGATQASLIHEQSDSIIQYHPFVTLYCPFLSGLKSATTCCLYNLTLCRQQDTFTGPKESLALQVRALFAVMFWRIFE